MKRLHFIKPNDLSRLHDGLLITIPALRPVAVIGRVEWSLDGLAVARWFDGTGSLNPGKPELRPVITVEGLADNIWLTVPDNANEAEIAAVVAAHDPATLPATPAQASAARIAEILAIPYSNWTTTQMRELLQLVALRIV